MDTAEEISRLTAGMPQDAPQAPPAESGDEQETRNQESRLRRALARMDMRLQKSPLHNRPELQNANDYGGYMIVSYNNGVEGGANFNWTLGDVEQFAVARGYQPQA